MLYPARVAEILDDECHYFQYVRKQPSCLFTITCQMNKVHYSILYIMYDLINRRQIICHMSKVIVVQLDISRPEKTLV